MRAMRARLAPGFLLLAALGCALQENRSTPPVTESKDAGAELSRGVEPRNSLDGGAPVDAMPGESMPVRRVVIDQARISSISTDPNFQRVIGEVDFSGGPFASAKMRVTLRTTCFPFEGWSQNPPPEGQRWPADCDAFDRNFEITLDPATTPTSAPGLELARAITPFGGPLDLEVDMTDIANGLPGRHRVEAYIATWSDASGRVTGSHGGWNVSVAFELTPGVPPRRVLAVLPLANLMHGASTPKTDYAFETPPSTTSARIEYRVTGHGGGEGGPACIGPAEEFCRRSHTVFVDRQRTTAFDAWRTDCATLCTIAHFGGPVSRGFDYCAENPCGSIQSVRAPRANWCPGSLTPPLAIEGDALVVPGHHTFSYEIGEVAEGGLWRVSAVYFAFQD